MRQLIYKLYSVDYKAKLVLWTITGRILICYMCGNKAWFHLVGCVSSIMGAGLHKITCYFMDYHYMMVKPVWYFMIIGPLPPPPQYIIQHHLQLILVL
jgi:hypothetical protein